MGTRDEYVSTIKSAFVSIDTRVTMMLLASLSMPAWLSWFGPVWSFMFSKGPVKNLIEHYVRKFYAKKTDKVELAAFFKYIDMRVGAQSKDFEQAAYENRTAQLTGDKNAIKKAEENLWDKFDIFVRLDS